MRGTQTIGIGLCVVSIVGFSVWLTGSASGQTTSSGLFGTQNLGTSLSPQSSTRISGTARSTSGLGTGNLSSLPISSGQFVNIGSVNTAEQLFGSNTFVGADTADTFNPLSAAQGTGTGTARTGLSTGLTGRSTLGTSNLMGLGTRGLLGSSRSILGSRTGTRTGTQMRGRAQQDIIPSSLRVGFSVPNAQQQVGGTPLEARLSRIVASRVNNPVAKVEVSLEGRTAVLKGTVPSANDRLVLERLLLLEPGVDKVQNELVVAGSSGQ